MLCYEDLKHDLKNLAEAVEEEVTAAVQSAAGNDVRKAMVQKFKRVHDVALDWINKRYANLKGEIFSIRDAKLAAKRAGQAGRAHAPAPAAVNTAGGCGSCPRL